MEDQKYSLIGVDGNAFCIMGYISNAMRRTGYSEEEIDKYLSEAQSSDYSNLVAVSSDQINKVNEVLISKEEQK